MDLHSSLSSRAAALLPKFWACFLLIILVMGLAAVTPAVAAPLIGSSYDSEDGDQANGMSLDWQGAVNAGRVTEVPDNNVADSCFIGGNKELNPANWAFNTSSGGCTPGKSNVRAAWANPESAPSTTFSHMAFWRNDTTGNSFLSFELNQSPNNWVNNTGTSIPCRTNDDVIISYEIGGSSLNVIVYKWTGDGSGPAACPNGASGTFTASGLLGPSVFQGTMNGSSAIANYLNPAAYGATLPANSFGEAGINLPAVLQSMGSSPCFGFLRMQVHSRSSSSISSALIDSTDAAPVYLQSCSASGTKYQDSNGNGTRDAGEPGLAGFNFYVDANSNDIRDGGEVYGTSDANGFYRILNVPAGTHTIKEEAIPGWTCSQPSPCSYTRSFITGGNSTGNDFGNVGPSSVSGSKYHDLNGNGTRDIGENGLAGYTFYVDYDDDNSKDAGEPGATSDSAGAWNITGVSAGTYKIREVAVAGYTCSNPSPCYYTETFSSNSTSSGKQFGNYTTGSVSGNIYHDLDADGAAKETDEGNLSGWTVYVDADGDDIYDIGETTTTTDASGNYSFPALAPGSYTIRVSAPFATWRCSVPSATTSSCEYSVAVTSSSATTGRNFAFWQNTTVSGTKFEDTNNNAVRDTGEVALGGFTFYLDYDGDSTMDSGEPSAISDTTGAWTITGGAAGASTLREVQQPGYTCTKPSPCSVPLTLTSGQSSGAHEFGNFIVRSVSGTVFQDLDADGAAREAGEPGRAGWTVYDDTNNNSVFDVGEPSVTTDSNGSYTLTGLPNGGYDIRIIPQTGWTCSFPVGCVQSGNQGGPGSAPDTGKNFGVYGPSSISGNLYEDLDADGAAKEAGEPNLSGRVVYVDSNNNSSKDAGEPEATTDASGNYTISGLAPGSKTVRQVLPIGWICSVPTPCSYTVGLVSQAVVAERNFASYTTGSITGTLYEDTDFDGQAREVGEPALAGREVYLDSNNDGIRQAGETATTTDGTGAYSFTVAPGDYVVRQTLPANWACPYPKPCRYEVATTSGSSATGRDFASYLGASVTGSLFEDLDADGSAREAGEPVLASKRVYLDANGDGIRQADEPTVLSDANGDFSFTGIEVASWQLRVDLESSWSCDSPDPCFTSLTLTSGSTASGNVFGLHTTGSIFGHLYTDRDGDQQPQEFGENDQIGRTVYVDENENGEFDTGEPSDTTDNDGNYAIARLEPGGHRVLQVLPAGWVCSTPIAPCWYNTTITSGENETDRDFSSFTTASISGRHFEDSDGDGAFPEPGEAGIDGRVVYVDLNDNGALDAGEPSDTTSGGGNYTLAGLSPGTYVIRTDGFPAGWTCSYPTPCEWTTTIEANEAAVENDFGSYTAGSLSGQQFEDVNANGSRDAGEPVLSGWVIYADLNGDGDLDSGEPSDTTDVDGNYSLELDPGDYTIRQEAQTGWTCSAPSPCSYAVSLDSSEAISTRDFGNWTEIPVSGQKFEDTNTNGVKDAGEAGLAGWTIYSDANDSGELDSGEISDTTDLTGNYSLDLTPGAHIIREENQAGWTCSFPAPCSYELTLVSGTPETERDFGNWEQGAVGGSLFEDENADGTREAGDGDLSGRTVYADLNGNGGLDSGEPSDTTDVDGSYSLDLDPGSYTIRQELPAGWICSTPSPCQFDVVVTSGSSSTGNDFGSWGQGAVTGSLYEDENADGTRDAGDGDLSGRVVYADLNDNGERDTGEATDTTDADGNYNLDLDPGSYTIRQELPEGWTCSAPAPCSYDIVVTSGSDSTGNDFGSWEQGIVSGSLYEDENTDGTRNAGDGDLSGRVVYVDANENGEFDTGEESDTTDASGNYSFDLDPGDYVIRQVLPGGWTCSDPALCAIGVTVTSGSDSPGNSFGSWEQGSVSGSLYEDENADGTRDTGDSDLANRTVYVDANDNGELDTGEATDTTGAGGAYSFSLDPGNYVIRQVLPEGWTCSDPDPCSYNATVTSGSDATNNDFASWEQGTITGTLYEDENTDGDRDAGDDVLAGRTVYVDTNDNSERDAGEATDTTTAGGVYSFTLDPGSYVIRQELPEGWVCSAPDPCSYEITVTSGFSSEDNDFGSSQAGTVSGTLYEDENADGTRDAGDGDLSGRVVYVDANDNGERDTGEAQDTTSADGAYSLVLDAGSYTIRQVLPEGWTCSAPAPCSYDIVVTSGSLGAGNDFASWEQGTVSGTLYEDENADGTRDAGDGDLVGRVVYVDANDNGERDTGEESDTTDTNGNYSFSLDPGSYVIRQVLPEGWTCSAPTPCSHEVTVTSGSTATNRDFASWTPGSVSGHLYQDTDTDGAAQEAGEPNLVGRSVYLDTNDNGDHDSGEPLDTTDADGNYSFQSLDPGNYVVRQVLPAHWTCTRPDPCRYEVAMTSGENITGRDFASAAPSNYVLTGTVFEDADANGGARASNEPAVAGQVVFIDSNNNGSLDNGERRDTSDQTGAYRFEGLGSGGYTLRIQNDNCSYPAPCARTVELTGSQSNLDFGIWKPATLSGVKFEDFDSDGKEREAGERGLEEWTVYLDLNNNGSLEAGEPQRLSSATGDYEFTGLRPGSYHLREVNKAAGWHCSVPADCERTVTLLSGEHKAGVDLGSWYEVKLSGYKFEDEDRDGKPREPGEAYLAGWKIYIDLNRNGSWDAGEPFDVTEEGGYYGITNLRLGTYIVREEPPVGGKWSCSYPSNCSYEITFRAGQAAYTANFGSLRRLASPRVRIVGQDGCQKRTFTLRVAGRRAKSIRWYVDGRRVRTGYVARKNGRRMLINPRRYKHGVHRVRARVTFTTRGMRPRNAYHTFYRCRAAKPRYTG